MKLAIVNSGRTVSFRSAYLEALQFVLGTHILIESATQPSWPQTWSDQLWVPESDFSQRRRARRFLEWIISLGVDADQWLEQVNLGSKHKPTIPPPKARGGGVGRAYIVGQRVVKITTDATEAGRASALIGMDVPNLTKFHGVAEVAGAGGGGKRLFVIVANLVPNQIPGKYRTAANAVYNYLDAYNRPIADVQQAAEEIMTNDRFLPVKYRDDPAIRSGVLKILQATHAVFERTGIMLQDPHGGNVLMRGQDIEFFDVGRSSDFGGAVQTGTIHAL